MRAGASIVRHDTGRVEMGVYARHSLNERMRMQTPGRPQCDRRRE